MANIDTLVCANVQWLCTVDIKSLYTNILLNEGIVAVREKQSEDVTLSNHKTAFLISLLEVVLTKNYLRFGT